MKMDQEQMQLRLFEIGQLSGDGSKYHQGDNLEQAVECYDKAYKLAREVNDDKTERTCAFNLGAAYIAIGNPEEGLKYLHKAMPPGGQADERSNGDLYFNMGLGNERMDNEEKALEDFLKAKDEYGKFETEKKELQIQCLEKCFQIYLRWKDFSKAAGICKQMSEVPGIDELTKAERLCERATHLRLANEKEEAIETAKKCKEVIENCRPQGQDCIIAGKIWNDLGLVFTQLQEYNLATCCFEKAVEQVRNSHKDKPELEAVVMQNLGAAYNFQGDYQRAIKFHEDAAAKYASINYRNGQGQCFTNLAFALSQLGERELKQAEIAFHHALQASVDTNDKHMKWQALEGLGAVNYNQGNVKEAIDFFIKALQNVGENQTASERIKNKMLHAMNGTNLTGVPYRGPGHMVYTGAPATRTERRMFMPTHGPVEEHNKLSTTPRTQERPIVYEKFVPVAGERPAMAAVQDTPEKPRRIIRMRKKDSFGPHHPKVALGLGSITYDSPRFQQDRRNTILQEESSEDESSSASGSSSDSSSGTESSGEDQADEAKNKLHQISLEKIEKIFEKKQESTQSPGGPDEEKHLSMYEAHIRAKDEDEDNEDSEDEDSSDESSSSEETETAQEDETHVKQVARQPAQNTADSPDEKSSSADDSGSGDDDDDKNDEKDPNATVDTTTKLRQPVNEQGAEDPYHSLKFERAGEQGESSAMKFEQLPRGKKEEIMAQYHHEHQSHSQEPPPLPSRQGEKSSKTCVVM